MKIKNCCNQVCEECLIEKIRKDRWQIKGSRIKAEEKRDKFIKVALQNFENL